MKRAPKYGLNSYTVPPNLKQLENRLEDIRKEKDSAVQSQEFEKAAALRDTEQKIREELDVTKNQWKEKQGRTDSEVTPEDIAQIVASWTGIPVSKLAEEETRAFAQYGRYSSWPRYRSG